jgi:hypothetical protein
MTGDTMDKLRRAITIGLVASSLTLTGAGVASAKISEVYQGCVNNGGNYAPGQQQNCQGGGQTPEYEFQNPAGKAPPGHNK